MDWLEYGVLFAVAAVVTIALTPLARKLAIKLDAIDYPSARRVNMLPIPRMGGVAIFGGILAALDHIHFDCIDSTNTYARQNASRLAVPCLITADMQTGGRGRRGNSFFSPKGTGTLYDPAFQPDGSPAADDPRRRARGMRIARSARCAEARHKVGKRRIPRLKKDMRHPLRAFF